MRIGILSRSRTLYSTSRLLEAGRKRGHYMLVIDTLQAARYLGDGPSFRRAGRKYRRRRASGRGPALPRVDAIIPRIGASITRYGVAVVQHYEARGIVTSAPAKAIEKSRDKLQSMRLMQEAQLPVPRTVLVANLQELAAAVDAVGGYPLVIKISRGTQGRGVILVENRATARAVLSVFFRHGQRPILVQEFIDEARGRDIRLFIVGDRCVAAMERTAATGEFRANLHRGGVATSYHPDTQTERLALQAAALHNLGVAGVDLIRSDRGPLLLEVNSSPGLEGIESASQVDVAGAIMHFLEQKRRNHWKKVRASP
ncbi:MAG: ATP-grasp domain-containing protein [Chloroflexota bacterium]